MKINSADINQNLMIIAEGKRVARPGSQLRNVARAKRGSEAWKRSQLG